MTYRYDKIRANSVEEFLQKLEEGYLFENIILDKDKRKDLFEYINKQEDSIIKQVRLGHCYFYGIGVKRDLDKAKSYYEIGAKDGNVEALNNLGEYYYEDGEYEEAVKWYNKANVQGFAKAINNIGKFFYDGYFVDEDYKEAIRWFTEAANRGCVDAQFHLAECYDMGDGVDEDFEKALYLYEKAANQGHNGAIFRLGNIYEYGVGVDIDLEKAMYWYSKGALLDDFLCNLAVDGLKDKLK